MKRLFFLLSFLLCWLSAAAGHAQNPHSIRDLILIGLEQNIGLQVEKINVPLSQSDVILEKTAFDSELFATAGYSETDTPFASSFIQGESTKNRLLSGKLGLRKRFVNGLQGELTLTSEREEANLLADNLQPSYRTALLLNLNQPLLKDFGQDVNLTDLRVRRNTLQTTRLGYLLQAQSVALQVEGLARDLATAGEVIKLREEALNLATDLLVANQRRYETGVIPVSEVQEAETAQENRRLNLSLAKQDYASRVIDLNRLLETDFPVDTPPAAWQDFSAGDRSEVPDFEQLQKVALDNRVDLQVSEYDLANSALMKDYYRNQLNPRLDLNLQLGLNGLSGEQSAGATGSGFAGPWSSSLSSLSDADGYQWGATLEFSIPLGNREAKTRLRKAQLQQRQQKYHQDDLQSAAISELRQQWVNLQQAAEQYDITKEFERLARVSLQQEQRRLEEGLSDTFRIISFQDKMIEAKISRINSLNRYNQSLARLYFASGIILQHHDILVPSDIKEIDIEDI